MSWWDAIVDYYKAIGERYSVNPVLFVGIHIVATPMFAAAVWWIIFSARAKRPLLFPVITATIVFNAANIYLIIAGKNIPWWIYTIVATTTVISGWFSIKRVQQKLRKAKPQ